MVVIAILLVALVIAATFHPLHDLLVGWSGHAATQIQRHGVAGAVIFVILSMLSAMLAFFSTAVLIPVAIAAWGKTITLLLVWSGWFLGGMASYAIGRFLGRAAVRHFIAAEQLDVYEQEIQQLVGFPQLLLLQLALPSEIPGYVVGMLRFRARRYFTVLALAELPFALGAVFLGESFLSGNLATMIVLGSAGLGLSWFAAAMLYRRRRTVVIPHVNNSAPVRRSPSG